MELVKFGEVKQLSISAIRKKHKYKMQDIMIFCLESQFQLLFLFVILTMGGTLFVSFLSFLLVLTLTRTCSYNATSNCLVPDLNNTYNRAITCVCLACASGQRISGNQYTCCPSNVSSCYKCQNLTCVTCEYQHGFIRNTSICNLCRSTIPYCQRCEYTDNCTICAAGYGFNGSTTKCSLCSDNIPNCYRCNSYAEGCTQCQSRYLSTNNNTNCAFCYLFMPYCSSCYSKFVCRRCNQTFYAVNQSVIPNFCQFCNVTLSDCATCQYVYYCTSCDKATYGLKYNNVSRNQTCQLCSNYMDGCYQCTVVTACLSCINQSYLLNNKTKLCEICSMTMPYCTTCNSSYYCLSCYDQRYTLVHLLNITQIKVCQPCDNLMKGCLYCSSSSICTKCLLGRATGGGCTTVVGCVNVNSTLSVESNCVACDPLSFYLSPSNGSLCVCLDGWPIGNYCTNIVGCTGLTTKNNSNVCICCDITGHFELLNNTCVCKKYYVLKGLICQQLCGDGHLIYLPCDDGNLVNGDGCSSSCQLQSNFVCENDNGAFPASKCQFKGKVILSLESIYKVAGKNQVLIVFDISPYSDLMLKMNLTQGIVFDLNGSILSSSQIFSQQLILTIDYFSDIEGYMAKMLVKFDSNYVLSPNFNLYFSMVESTGLTLNYEQSPLSSNELFGIVANIIGYSLIAVFILGSACYKMIGVQTIHTVQTILNLQAASLYYKTLFSDFKGLKIAYGQISSFITSSQPIKQSFYVNLGYKLGINNNYAVLGLLNLFVISSYILVKAVGFWLAYKLQQLRAYRDNKDSTQASGQQRTNLKGAQKLQDKESKIRQISRVIYNCLLFPLLIGFAFQLLNVKMIIQSHSNFARQSSYKIFAINFIYIATVIIFFQEFISLFVKSSQHQALLKPNKKRYIPIFLLFSLGNFMLTITLSQGFINNQFGFVAIGGLNCCYLIFLIFYRPYSSSFHNVTIVFNQLTIIFQAVWIIIKSRFMYSSKIQDILRYAFIFAISILLLLAIIRLVFAFREIYCNNNPPTKIKKPIKQTIVSNFNISVDVNQIVSQDISLINKYRQNLFEKKQHNHLFQDQERFLEQDDKRIHKSMYRKMFRKKYKEQE